VLGEAAGRDFGMDAVLFIDRNKLPCVRTRLDLSALVSETKNTIHDRGFFKSAEAFAVVGQRDTSEDIKR
jgi:hypothetical protein